MDVLKHTCLDNFTEDSLDKSDTKIVIKGHCSLCCYRMTKIYRYMGTYGRDTFKKLDPLPQEAGKRGMIKDAIRFEPA